MRFVTEPLLPKGYTRLEYIESTGAQYILTGFTPTVNTDFELELSSTKTSTNWAMGCPTWVGVHYKGVDGQIGVTNSSTSDFQQYVNYARDNTRITMKLQGNTVYANGVSLGTITRRAGTLDFALFGYRDANRGATLFFSGSIYKCKLWDNGTLVRDFYPALRNSDSEPGMYDIVSGTFYTNAGTGTFNYVLPKEDDNVIDNPKYQQVEYLQSTGTQYIDTGYAPVPATTKIDFVFSPDTIAGNSFIFGCRPDTGIGGYSCTTYFATGSVRQDWAGLGTYFPVTTVGTKYHYTAYNNTINLNEDSVTGTSTRSTTRLSQNFLLFTVNTNGTADTRRFIGKIYYSKLWDNGTLVRHLVPAIRKVDNKPGMYDKVTGQFFTNSNTTGDDFLYGDKVYNVLPSKYEKLEYLKSDGTQYIDTGISAKTGLSIEAKIKYTTINGILCGAITTSTGSGDRYYALNFSQSNKVAFTYLDSAFSASTTLTPNEMYTIKTVISNTRQEMFINGVSAGYTTKTNDVDLNFTLGLFALHRGGSFDPEWFSEAALPVYYCKIWDGDTLVRYFQPALRKSDNKPGMYDFVSGQFFTNLGTGEFTYDYPVKPLSNSKLRLVKTGGYTIYDDLYKEVEYLQSTGTQYIDTGIAGSNKIRMEVICQGSQADKAVAGCGETNDRLQIYAGATYYSVRIDGAATTSTAPSLNKAKIILDAVNKKADVNGTDYSLPYTETIANTNIHLFRVNRTTQSPSSTTYNFIGKIWQFKLYDNGILVRDFVPVIRIGDSKSGMYDKVTRTFFTNAGTGEFIYPTPTYAKPLVTRLIAGGYIASIYKPLQYLESTGTQYIDIGINGDLNTKAEILYRYPSASSVSGSGRVMGSRTGASSNGFGIGTSSGSIIVNEGVGAYFSNANIGTATVARVVINTWYQTILSQDGAYFNGTKEEFINGSVTDFTTPNNLKLFGFDNNGTMGYGKVQISKFKLWSNGALVRDFVPVLRTLDNKPGMYDKVTGQFFTNQGTGEFSYA